MKGMRCYIYRSSLGDCSNGGLSGRVDHVTVVGVAPNGKPIPEIFDETEDAPAVVLGETLPGYWVARPAQDPEPGHTGWMAGGCFIYSGDSRFPTKHPIPLHDRCETWEHYEMMTR